MLSLSLQAPIQHARAKFLVFVAHYPPAFEDLNKKALACVGEGLFR